MLRRPIVITRIAKPRNRNAVQADISRLEIDGWFPSEDEASDSDADDRDGRQPEIEEEDHPVASRNAQSGVKDADDSDTVTQEKCTITSTRNSDGRLECSVCNVEKSKLNQTPPTFVDMTSFRKHRLRKHHDLWKKSGGKDRPCHYACQEDDCDQKFAVADKLVLHLHEQHSLSEFALCHEEFSSREEYHAWKLVKLEQTITAMKQSTSFRRQNGDMVHSSICYRSKLGVQPYVRKPKKNSRSWDSCPAYIKAVELYSEGASEPGSYPVRVEYCLTHYGHDPAEDIAHVKHRLRHLETFPESDFHPRSKSGKNRKDNPSDLDTSLQPFDPDSFNPVPVDSFDPVSGEPRGQAEINKLHAGIILKLQDISTSGAKETVELLEELDRQVDAAREAALLSKWEEEEEEEELRRLRKGSMKIGPGSKRKAKVGARTRKRPWRLVVNENLSDASELQQSKLERILSRPKAVAIEDLSDDLPSEGFSGVS